MEFQIQTFRQFNRLMEIYESMFIYPDEGVKLIIPRTITVNGDEYEEHEFRAMIHGFKGIKGKDLDKPFNFEWEDITKDELLSSEYRIIRHKDSKFGGLAEFMCFEGDNARFHYLNLEKVFTLNVVSISFKTLDGRLLSKAVPCFTQ